MHDNANTESTDIAFEQSIYLFNRGENFDSYLTLGCTAAENGFRFAVWAPNAQNVFVVGDFHRHIM